MRFSVARMPPNPLRRRFGRLVNDWRAALRAARMGPPRGLLHDPSGERHRPPPQAAGAGPAPLRGHHRVRIGPAALEEEKIVVQVFRRHAVEAADPSLQVAVEAVHRLDVKGALPPAALKLRVRRPALRRQRGVGLMGVRDQDGALRSTGSLNSRRRSSTDMRPRQAERRHVPRCLSVAVRTQTFSFDIPRFFDFRPRFRAGRGRSPRCPLKDSLKYVSSASTTPESLGPGMRLKALRTL